MSHFTKKQADVITNQIQLLDADREGLSYFSIKLKRDRDTMFELIKQSIPTLKDYVFYIKCNAKEIRIVIDTKMMKDIK